MVLVRRIVAAAVLTTATVLAPAPGAWAHGSLVDSSPPAGETVDTAPSEVALTFSDPLRAGGAAVVGPDGGVRDWVTGAPVLDGTSVTVDLDDGLPAGEYEVRWRAVGSDGHPVLGVFSFSVGGQGGAPAPGPEPRVLPEPRLSTGAASTVAAGAVALGVAGTVLIAAAVSPVGARRRRHDRG